MARPKKDGKRATGIQGKNGYLYIVISQPVIKDGVKKYEKKWIATRLTDTAQNVKLASQARARLLNKKHISSIDLNITIAEYIDIILEKKKRQISDTTYAAYYYKGKKIKTALGSIKVKDLSEGLVEDFLDSLFVIEHLQPRTVKDIKVLFANIIGQAVQEGIITYNPVKEVAINKKLADQYANEKKADQDFFSYDEAQFFLEKIKNHELYELFYLTLFFGLRREEILGLRWSSIDFKKKTMLINHTVTKGITINRTNTTKTEASTRTYPLTEEQVGMFQLMKKREKSNRKLFGNCYTNSDYIFKHTDGTLYYPDYPTKAFRKIIKKIPELPQNITFHGLRSSCVSILVHQGMDVKSIQKWVGHSDIDTTLRIYAKVKDKEAKQEVSEAMKSIIPIKNYGEK